jgi:hypothetical protein
MEIRAEKLRQCNCRKRSCLICTWEAKLVKSARKGEDFDHLDLEDDEGNIVVSHRGSGNINDGHLDSVEQQTARRELRIAELNRRQAVAANHRFKNKRERIIYELWAQGDGEPSIALYIRTHSHSPSNGRRFKGVTRSSIRRTIERIEREYQKEKTMPLTLEYLTDLVEDCDREMLAFTFALVRKALDRPAEMRALLDQCEKVPALAALLPE